jgi:N-acetylated-alpha-linked acidic dipeptidase
LILFQPEKYSMRKILVVLSAITFSFSAQAQNLAGFTAARAQQHKTLEQQFDAQLDAAHIGQNVKILSAKPHSIGSPGGKENAEYLLNEFKKAGWDAKIETYTVLFPTPKIRVLEMTAPTKYTAILKELALKEDATSGQADQLPTYNAWSADGDVSGELVFVNYGLPEDYETLNSLGVSVKGKIVIAKYGRSWRGIKPKVAQEHGALGCIIYSDPKDDGYARGDVYPKGAYKNETGVQRGSIMDMVIYPGDPLTPNVGATENAQRLDRLNATNLLKIPVIPISYKDALPLLSALEGEVVPAAWAGGLPITYHIGPGKAVVHLKMEFDWKMVPAYDVIATIKGSELPDQWVMRGNHHDAWVNGANDPISGLASLLEEAKAIGVLVKHGWKPKRTLVYCAWDGEEPGLMGSTEYAEDHAKELQEKAVVYINTDASGRGFLSVEGSHALETLMTEVSKDIVDPQTNVTVFERAMANDIVDATSVKARKDLMARKNLQIGAMGSGSDYSSFIQHLGVPALDIGFGGESNGGEYHSIYDSYDDYVRFKDPGFAYGVVLSKTAGHAALRMADADVLPFDFTSTQKTISEYVADLISMTDQLRETTVVNNQLVKQKLYSIAADPTHPYTPPVAKAEVPYMDFSPLQNALHQLEIAANNVNSKLRSATTTTAEKNTISKKLYQAEQQLLTTQGLPRRSWYRHTIYAPGFYTGYGVKTLPGIREAIEQRNFAEAQQQVMVVATAIGNLSKYLEAL